MFCSIYFFYSFFTVFLSQQHYAVELLNCTYFYDFEFQILEIWESGNRLRKQKMKIESRWMHCIDISPPKRTCITLGFSNSIWWITTLSGYLLLFVMYHIGSWYIILVCVLLKTSRQVKKCLNISPVFDWISRILSEVLGET